MIVLLIFSLIVGFVVAVASEIGILGVVVGGLLFCCGLPFALVTSFIHGEVSYAQDRADYRSEMADLAEVERAIAHDIAEEERLDRLIKSGGSRTTPTVYHDNRQIHYHGDTK